MTNTRLSILSTLKRVQNQHEQNPRDVNAYAECYLKIIAINADECGVWYDAASKENT